MWVLTVYRLWQEQLIALDVTEKDVSPESCTLATLISQVECGLPVSEGHQALLANEMLVAVILWMYCHCSVTQNCLGPGGSHRQVLFTVCYLILEKV